MQSKLLGCSALAIALFGGCAGSTTTPAGPSGASPELWAQVAGQGDPTVVFEAGGGEDSSAWAAIEPEVRILNGVRTLVYDRAGLGKSRPGTSGGAPATYHIDDEVAALQRTLDRCAIHGPIVVVAHSYGGFVAMLLAASDARVAGVVLVDAVLAEFFDKAELARIEAKYAPQFPELERIKPELARVMIPLMRAYPETVRRVGGVTFPPRLPTIDIVAEGASWDTEDENAAWRRVHAAFVAASPMREEVVAIGSGHHVNRDRPDVVIEAIARIVRRVRAH